MWRYIGVSIVIGLITSTLVFLLYETGIFLQACGGIFEFYEESGLMPEGGAGKTFSDILQFAVFVSLAFGIAWAAIDIPRANFKVTVAVCAAFLVFSLSPTLALHDIYFEPFSGFLAIILSLILGMAYSRTRQGQRKRLIHAVMGSRISPDTFHKLLGVSDGDLPMKAARREVSVLTCRVFNHPALMRELEPDDLVELTNLLLKNTAEHLVSKGAYVDESRPHLVRVFFGIQPGSDHAADACIAALELKRRITNLNTECERRWFQTLDYGIGVSSGELTTGVFGSRGDVYFSALGGEIEFSRRLCGLNTTYGSSILISASSYMKAKDFVEVRPMEMVYMEESDVMAEVYEILDERGRLTDDQLKSRDAFWQGMIYYREGKYDSALESFDKARLNGKTDLPLEHYLVKVRQFLLHPRPFEDGEGEDLESMSG